MDLDAIFAAVVGVLAALAVIGALVWSEVAMNTVARLVVLVWLVAALVVLWLDGLLPVFLVWTLPASVVVLVSGAVMRVQLAPSRYNRPSLPERYRLADDLAVPLCVVVAVAEREAAP